MRKTVLIFGASSFVGSNLVESLRDEFRVITTFHNSPLSIPGVLSLPCDVHNKDKVSRLVQTLRPHVTIYAAGLSSIAACNANPKLAAALKSAGLINVCSAAERVSSKFIFFSSSFVLGGEDMVYKESDTPFPTTTYGSTLASSEFFVQKSCLNYIVFRCCPLYGRTYHPKRRNWFESLEKSIALGLPVAMDDHVLHGHLDVQLLAKLVKISIQQNVTNRLLQVSSKDVLSRYDFAKLYCQLFKKDENLVTRAQWELPPDGNQARMARALAKYNYKMDLKNAEEFFKFRFPTVEESLTGTRKRLLGSHATTAT